MNPPLTDWPRSRVWVVGASSGIGSALAEALLARGARVALSARRGEALQSVAAAAPDRALVVPADVTDPDGVHRAWQAVEAAWGGVDLVLCVAGAYVPASADAFDAALAARLFDLNVMGTVRVVDAVLPSLLARGSGHLSVVASVAGYRALPRALFYGPTKAALIHLAEGLHLDLRPRGIGVSVVNPGFVRTPATAVNDFHMPALLSPEEAAEATLRGLERGAFEIHFPHRFTNWLKLLRLLPYRWYFPLVHRITGL